MSLPQPWWQHGAPARMPTTPLMVARRFSLKHYSARTHTNALGALCAAASLFMRFLHNGLCAGYQLLAVVLVLALPSRSSSLAANVQAMQREGMVCYRTLPHAVRVVLQSSRTAGPRLGWPAGALDAHRNQRARAAWCQPVRKGSPTALIREP